ncbi:MAG: HEAT repeat domain-containing protein [Chloroflexi bacterium]|nr:HEAT repeat domain-containing protein [Chloroflexota bacterium]
MIFLSYHNIDLPYAFQLSNLLIRYYRHIWLDRFEVGPVEDWQESIRGAYDRASGALVIVSDDYLESAYCRQEYEQFRRRNIPVIAVIPRDFSTEKIADFAFDDWIDFRRWFDEPDDLSVENLLNQIPQSEAAAQTGERSGYLRQYIAESELYLAKLPMAWTSLRVQSGQAPESVRPRAYPVALLQDWAFAVGHAEGSLVIEDLLGWSAGERQFVLQGDGSSGRTFFARLLSLVHAHAALRDSHAPLPIWLDLTKWDATNPSLSAFMESEWQLISYWKHWLGSNTAVFFLNNWSGLNKQFPSYAAELRAWISASADHRFVLLAREQSASGPDGPVLSPGAITAGLALKLASACLSLEQVNSFRQILRQQEPSIIRNQLDYLSLGIELVAADTALAVNHWQRNPLPAVIAARSQQMASARGSVEAKPLIDFCRNLAWSMMQLEAGQQLPRQDVEEQASEKLLVDFAIEIGILEQAGAFLRFGSAVYQWYLAAGHISKHGLQRYLTVPQFTASGARAQQKWEPLILILVDNLAEEARRDVIEEIAETDPFLASACLARHPTLYESAQEALIDNLAQAAAQHVAARSAFRACINSLPDFEKTAELLVGQMSGYDKTVQLWLWKEILALRLDLSIAFVELVASIDRNSPTPVIESIREYRLWLAVAYLVKLSRNPDPQIQANAIWMLGQIKFLPTAVLLLDYLESGEGLPRDEIVLALMNYAYSDILASLLRWSQENPEQLELVVEALRARGRAVSSRLLAFANEGRLTLNPAFYEAMVDHDESDLAIGLAQLAGPKADLPEAVEAAIASHKKAEQMRSLMAGAIKHLPKRDDFQQLLDDVARVLEKPPESTVIAGSNLGALLYGDQTLEGLSAQAELPPALAPPDDGIPDDIERQLRHRDWQERHRALERLAAYPAANSLPHLLDMTSDSETLVRLATYEILWRFSEDVAARKALVAALSDPQQAIVDAAAELLTDCPDLALDDLLELLDSDKPSTVAAVIGILQAGKYAPALDALSRLRDDRRRPPDKGASIGELASRAVAAIAETVAEPAAAAEAGQAFSDEEKVLRTLELLRDDDWGRTQKAAKFLRKFARHLRGREHDTVLRILCAATEDKNWHVRWAVCEALAWLPDQQSKRHLSLRLEDPNWIVQVAAIRALAVHNAADTIDRMIPLLGSPQQAVRETVAEALGELGQSKAIRALADAFRGDKDNFVRLAALKSIQQINPNLAREHLEHGLSDAFIHLRWYAAKTLAPVFDEADMATLARLLGDEGKPDWEEQSIRDFAIAALRRIDSPESRAAIKDAPQAAKRTEA